MSRFSLNEMEELRSGSFNKYLAIKFAKDMLGLIKLGLQNLIRSSEKCAFVQIYMIVGNMVLGKLADKAFSRQGKMRNLADGFIIIGHKSLSNSVVIVSYQVPRAAEAWPWPARHGQMRITMQRYTQIVTGRYARSVYLVFVFTMLIH